MYEMRLYIKYSWDDNILEAEGSWLVAKDSSTRKEGGVDGHRIP